MKRSAGIMAYRWRDGAPELFLVHPGGPFWKNEDDGAWSIPKGEIDPDEDPLMAARREFREETGQAIDGAFIALDPVKIASGKVIVAWAIEHDLDASGIRSNSFEIEWPPRSGKKQVYPEVDRAAWFPAAEALRKINKGQAPLITQVLKTLGIPPPQPSS